MFAASTIPVGDAPRDVHLVESRNLLFVTNQISNTVSIIDITTDTVIKTVPVGNTPIESVYVTPTSLLYVGNSASNDVSVIDVTNPLTAAVITTIPVGTFPFSIDYNSSNEQVYVSNSFSNSVSVIDVDSGSGSFNTVIKNIPVGSFPTGIGINDSTNRIYVGNLISNQVSVIDGNTDAVDSTLTVFGPGEIGIDQTNNRIFVANGFSDALTIIDGITDTEITTIPTGIGPRESKYNPITNQILVSNAGGTLSVFDGTSFNSLGEIPIGNTPLGLEVTTSNVIYVATQDIDVVTVVDLFSNVPPVAKAGPNQIVTEGDIVHLDGSGSSDFNGDPLIFKWTQTDGPNVVLSSLSDPNPTFNAPNVDANTSFEFQLVVNDGVFDSMADFVNVIVRDITVFEVPLNPVGDQLEGEITLDTFPANSQITFDFINPDEITEGKLEDAKITSTITGSNIEFDFVSNIEEPETVPPLDNPALFYEFENTGIDFSNISNLPPNNLPTSQFSVNKNYLDPAIGRTFSDGCPVVNSLILNEDSGNWEIIGNPEIPNTNKIYALDRIGNQIFVIDGNTNEKITTIAVGINPSDAIFEPTLNKLYVTNLDSGTVSVINTLTNTVQNTIPIAGAGSLELDSTTEKLYVASFGLGDITVIDIATDSIVDTIDTPGTTLNNLDMNSNLQRLYAVDSTANALFVIDIETKSTIGFVPLGGVPTGISVNPNNNSIYISIFTSNSVSVIDEGTIAVIKKIPVGFGPAGLEVNAVTNRVYVANSVSGTVSVIDSSINAEIGTISLLPSTLNIAINENTDRLYVSNQFFGTVSVLDGSKMELLDTITSMPGIFGITINPAISNPVRDPSNDILDSEMSEILECAYISKLPHLSKFAVGGIAANVLAGVGGGGGSGAPTSSLSSLSFNKNFYIPDEIKDVIENFDPHIPLEPMNPDLFENFDFPMTIKYNSYSLGYPLAGFENTIEPNVVQSGTPVTLTFTFFEQTDIQHFSFYSGLYGSKSNPSESNIQILYNKDKEPKIIDPLKAIANVTVTKNDLENDKKQIVVEFTPIKENSMKDLIVRVWDPQLASMDTIIRNVFDIVPSDFVETQIPTYDEPIIEEIKTQKIPIWIKNNAGWWSEQQIGDEDFVAGIEYLIKNGIIKVPGIEVKEDFEPTEIPEWVQNNAGWWSESLISDKEFVAAMQFLIENGVIHI